VLQNLVPVHKNRLTLRRTSGPEACSTATKYSTELPAAMRCAESPEEPRSAGYRAALIIVNRDRQCKISALVLFQIIAQNDRKDTLGLESSIGEKSR
jgi:hypothetical protein